MPDEAVTPDVAVVPEAAPVEAAEPTTPEPAAPAAEPTESAETPAEPAEPADEPAAEPEADDEPSMESQLLLAAEIVRDPTHEQHQLAKEMLTGAGLDYLIPEDTEADDDIPLSEMTPDEQLAFLTQKHLDDQAAAKERKEQEEMEAGKKRYQEDALTALRTVSGDDNFPAEFEQMSDDQKLLWEGTLLQGDAQTPEELVQFAQAAKKRLDDFAQRAIDAHYDSKPDSRPIPITGRTATTTAPPVTNVRETLIEAGMRHAPRSA